jgi:hypothetical protein
VYGQIFDDDPNPEIDEVGEGTDDVSRQQGEKPPVIPAEDGLKRPGSGGGSNL